MSPGPSFLWLGEKHLEALATLKYGISENKGFLLLTGDVGVGKTALIHRLIKELDGSKIVAYVPNPGMASLDFFNILSIELGIDQKFASKGAFLIEFKKFLYKNQSEGKKVLLVIDEAQRLYHELLEEIRLLSNIEMENQKLINIFFVGQKEFNPILLEPRNRPLRQRIAVRYQVEPLNQQETSYYIVHRLKVAGATRKIFKINAFQEIFSFSNGCPRLINIICDHALLTGYAAGLSTIGSNLIKECIPELNLPDEFDISPVKLPLPEPSNLSKSKPPPSLEAAQIGNLRTHSHRFNFRSHPILIGLLGILIGFMSYYLLWPTNKRSTQPTTLQELTAPLDKKTEAILGKRPKSNETIDEAKSQEPKEIEPSITEAELTQETLDLEEPKPAPEILADTQTTTADQSAPVHKSENSNPPSVHLEEESVENLEVQTKDAPLISTNDSPSSKQDSDSQENISDRTKSEKLVSVLPSGQEILAEEKSINKSEPTQLQQDSISPPLKEIKVADTKPKQPDKPIIENDKKGISSATSPQNTTPDIKGTKPDQLTQTNNKEPTENITLAKRDPSIDSKLKIDKLESRVRSFLEHYCNTYAAKKLGNFARLFGPDATENGKSFSTLLPKYKNNFNAIEKIEYRIDLQKYSYEEKEKAVKIEGKFLLKWRPYGQNWRENTGKIFMSLYENDKSFLIQRLDYYGDRAKDTSGSESRSP